MPSRAEGWQSSGRGLEVKRKFGFELEVRNLALVDNGTFHWQVDVGHLDGASGVAGTVLLLSLLQRDSLTKK